MKDTFETNILDNCLQKTGVLDPAIFDDPAALLREDARRTARIEAEADFDPVRGTGCCGPRVRMATPVRGLPFAFVPQAMAGDARLAVATSEDAWRRLRCRHDFEYWCAAAVRIKPKTGFRDVPFVLNAPQRRLAAMFEEDRRAGRPLRYIMLKSRQWGGSTLVQVYMAWIQLMHRTNWHSLICGHVKDTAAGIRGMYNKVLQYYPDWLAGEDMPRPVLTPFERSQNTRVLVGRDNRITLGSAENQDAIRGLDYAMAHLSEVAFWPATPRQNPEDFVRAINGSIADVPMTMVVMESTANGTGNYFHAEWLRNSRGEGDKRCIFVPWYEIAHNTTPLADRSESALRRFAAALGDEERRLFTHLGCTLDQVNWYHRKRLEYPTQAHLYAEFPTTPDQAFVATGNSVFDAAHVQRLRLHCTAPQFVGETDAAGTRLVPDARGCLQVWQKPQPGTAYVAAVDIGGRTATADWSVIAVLTAGTPNTVVAQWRGHIDHDLLADRARALAHYYNDALLVVESNTLEQEAADDPSLDMLQRLYRTYANLYMRPAAGDGLDNGGAMRPGFHTNRRTKPLLINTLIQAVREGTYAERCAAACDELSTYCQMPNGSYAARPGRHDDMLMTRALALFAARTVPRVSAADLRDLARQPVWR